MKSSIVLVIVSASQGMAADAGGDFSNNLFSDLAPLLALFGEQFAKQFMSQSMGWLDHVIFAMAPLGILTAIVAAIRVGGPPWLKAVIGRARENRATIEMELMSSTSHEVCELWNGQGVVRSMGRPRIGQIIYLEALKDDDETFGLYNIDNVEEHLEREPPLFQNESNTSSSSGESNVQIQNGAPDDEESQMQAVEINEGAQPQKTPPKGQRKLKADNEPAPNVSLNVHDGCSPGELYSAALFGILLQSGMLVFCGVSVYYPSFSHRFTVDGGTVKPYAYPIMALGTVLLAIGMVICSAIVEQSTQEAVYKPVGKLLENPRVRVLWLQKSHTVSDQKFDSCVLFKPDDSTQQDRIRTSVRVDPSDPSKSPQGLARIASTPTEVLTVVGVFLSLCGFILQFQGLRGMNWSASIAQLVCIMLMTIWRAWVRRGLIATPISRDVLENHEMDWLALEIARSKASGNGSFWPSHGRESSENAQNNCSASEPVKDPSWEICTGDGNRACAGSWTRERPNNSHITPEIDASWGTNALKIRRRLGRLTKWDGKTALPSVAVAKSIEILMNTLFDGKKPGSEEKEERSSEEGFTDKTCFSWSVGVLVDKEPGKIQFQVKRSAPGKDWKIDSTYIDAALSLWMFHISAQEARREEVNENKADTDWLREDLELREKVVRLLGLKHSSKALQRDIKWWVGDVPINENDDNNILPGTEASALVVGFASMDSEWQASDVPESAKSTMTSDASSRFTNSITVMSQGSLVLSLAQHIFSSFMRAIAEKIPPEKLEPKETSVERADLFRAHDPETMLSLKLENKTLTRMASQIQQTGLGSLQETYLCMIPALSQSKNLPMNAVIDCIREKMREHESLQNWPIVVEVYRKLFREFGMLGIHNRLFQKTTAILITILVTINDALELRENQGRQDRVEELREQKEVILNELRPKGTNLTEDPLCDLIVHFACLFKNVYRPHIDLCKELSIGIQVSKAQIDFSGSEGLDNNSTLGREEFQVHERANIEDIDINDGFSDQDLAHKFFKHKKCFTSMHSIRDLGAIRNDPGARDVFGCTPLHIAMERNDKSSRILSTSAIHFDANAIDLADANAIDLADVNAIDLAEWTPMHYAVRGGISLPYLKPILEFLIVRGADVNMRDRDGIAPLHLAASHDRLAVSILLKAGASVGILDNSQRTPLHYAAFDGCVNNIKLLLEKNAEKGATDDYGRVPLHLAAVAGHKEVVEILLEGEKDQSYLLDKQGRTPLHLAAMKGKDDVLSVLLGERSKADRPSETYTNVRKGTDIKDECSIKALDLAVVFGHENAAEILFDECAYNEDEIEVSLSLAAVFARINVIPFILAKAGLDIGAKVYNRHRKIGYYQILCVAMMYDC